MKYNCFISITNCVIPNNMNFDVRRRDGDDGGSSSSTSPRRARAKMEEQGVDPNSQPGATGAAARARPISSYTICSFEPMPSRLLPACQTTCCSAGGPIIIDMHMIHAIVSQIKNDLFCLCVFFRCAASYVD
jgi:hypothetical protein